MTNVASTQSLPNIHLMQSAEASNTSSQATAQPKPASIKAAADQPHPFSSVRTIVDPWLGSHPTHPFSSGRTVPSPWLNSQPTHPFSSRRTVLNPWLGSQAKTGSGQGVFFSV
jgi:hypothetical protein